MKSKVKGSGSAFRGLYAKFVGQKTGTANTSDLASRIRQPRQVVVTPTPAPVSRAAVESAVSTAASQVVQKVEFSENRLGSKIEAVRSELSRKIDDGQAQVSADIAVIKAEVSQLTSVLNENHNELNRKLSAILARLPIPSE